MYAHLLEGKVVAVCCNHEPGLPKPVVDAAIFAELAQHDIYIGPGMMGENITIEGIDVMQLAEGTHLAIGSAIVEVIEKRNPCNQLNGIDPRLLKAVAKKQAGQTIFKAWMMTRILQTGWVRAGDLVEAKTTIKNSLTSS
jgi:MOSC domain-containing protein YiiM